MSVLRFYNTLTGKKEPFSPIDPNKKEVRMYNCGPTVYNYAHIGNLRAYVFADVLRRTLEYNGYKVKQVMNITDVGHLTSDGDDGDDKMVKALKRDNLPMTLDAMRQVADKYSTAFVEDLEALNCELPHEMPRASDHISEDIELIKKLEEKGVPYKTSDGMYFDTSKFPDYGKLGNINLKGQLAGARVAVNSEKKNPADFTLWKKSHRQGSGQADNDIGWESLWGKGFPGWHIECSAMSRKYLGQPFDIHTGGIDHIPVHHNNEIAQSEAAYDVPLANVWMHNEFLNMSDGKMAKSGENFITLQTLKDKGIHPLTYRFFLLAANYRTPVTFSQELIRKVQAENLYPLYITVGELPRGGVVNEKYRSRFLDALGDDLNTAEALSLVYAILGDAEHLPSADKRATIMDFDRVFGLDIDNQSKKLKEEMNSVPDDIKKLASTREDARRAKDFKKSDELRAKIEKEGFEVMDTDSGTIIRKYLS